MLMIQILLLILIACIVISVKARKNGEMKWIEGRSMDTVLFLLSAKALFISIGLFINRRFYVENYQISDGGIELVVGGLFWQGMEWLELPVLLCLTLVSGIRIISQIRWAKGKKVDVMLFLLSAVALFTSVSLFFTLGIYIVDLFGDLGIWVTDHPHSGLEAVAGGSFWLSMKWLEFAILFCLSLILGSRLVQPSEKLKLIRHLKE